MGLKPGVLKEPRKTLWRMGIGDACWCKISKVVYIFKVRKSLGGKNIVNSICRHLLFVCEIAFDMATELPTRSLAQTQRIKQCALACADCERRWKREKDRVSLSVAAVLSALTSHTTAHAWHGPTDWPSLDSSSRSSRPTMLLYYISLMQSFIISRRP